MSEDTPPPVSPLMTPDETSQQLGLTPEQLQAARERNTGPEFYTLSPRLIRYNRADVLRHTAGRAPCRQP
jgi:hypothetical protein